jgi:hypothetical protein
MGSSGWGGGGGGESKPKVSSVTWKVMMPRSQQRKYKYPPRNTVGLNSETVAHGRLLGGRPPVRRPVEDIDLAAGRNVVVAAAAEQAHYLVISGDRAVSQAVGYLIETRRLGLGRRLVPGIRLQWRYAVRKEKG